MKKLIIILATAVAMLPVILCAGCGEDDQLPVPDPPASAGGQTEASVETIVPEETPETETGTEEEDPVETESPDFVLISDTAEVTFPDKITFSLECTSETGIEKVVLHYGDDRHTLVQEAKAIEVDIEDPNGIVATWDLEMKIFGSAPPGTDIWWYWELTDTDDTDTCLPQQAFVYTDTRYDWKCREEPDMDIYWKSDNESLIDELVAELEEKLARVELTADIPDDRKIKIFVYEDVEELKGALLHEQEWIGAVAFINYNTILIPVSESNLEWGQDTLAHETTHLIVHEITFGPFGDIPTWLDEGLALYSEGDLEPFLYTTLVAAFEEDSLVSLSTLAGTFPADPNQAYLAYAESGHVTAYLIEEYGWEKMQSLLDVLKTGSSIDNALQEVYGFGLEELNVTWQDYLAEEIT